VIEGGEGKRGGGVLLIHDFSIVRASRVRGNVCRPALPPPLFLESLEMGS
jgi:hypothetical protein